MAATTSQTNNGPVAKKMKLEHENGTSNANASQTASASPTTATTATTTAAAPGYPVTTSQWPTTRTHT
jgi:hypothetical protein